MSTPTETPLTNSQLATAAFDAARDAHGEFVCFERCLPGAAAALKAWWEVQDRKLAIGLSYGVDAIALIAMRDGRRVVSVYLETPISQIVVGEQ